MATAIHHAESSVRKWGGCVDDYLEIHKWFDATKAHLPDMRHRAIRHHSQGVEWCEEVFGDKIYLHNDDGSQIHFLKAEYAATDPTVGYRPKWIPTKWVAEQHVQEDMGWIPTIADWLRELPMEPRWMAARAQKGEKIAGLETVR